ncbi:SDR family NAD(P)-dependent oxidoreductase [Novosphingobium pentaromativorans]|nr:SDR family NAD(P)-dependent oxidoreductase [Novosphingobium pentaromativorans]
MDQLELEGGCAVVTGAGSGIGRALALEAARRGLNVALSDIAPEALAETLAMVEAAGGSGMARTLDVRDAQGLELFARDVENAFGSPALVFANAGVLKYGSTIRPDLSVWRRTVEVNVLGPVNTVHAFLGRMVDAARPAQFVITGSMGSLVSVPELASYTASKHAMWALADSLAIELADQDAVGVSLLCPPRVDTPILNESEARIRSAQGEEAARSLRRSAMTPAEVASCAFDGAIARRLYITQQIEGIAPLLRQRIAKLIDL